MERFLSIILAMTAALASPAWAGLADGTPPRTLRDSIQTAIKLNPKTVSTDEMLESIHFSTLAVKAATYPRGSVSCGVTYSRGGVDYSGSFSLPSRNRSTSCGLNASMVIYDGGAGRYRYEAARASEEAAKASYNTADSMISNTRGGLAYNTMRRYMDLVLIKARLDYFNYVLGVYQVFQKLGPSDTNLKNAISNIQLAIEQLTDELGLSKLQYANLVTLAPADSLENMDETIASMKIPASIDDAIRIATSEAPEVKRRNSNVEMADYSLKAEKASVGPTVSVSANFNRGDSHDFNDPLMSYRSNGRSIGVQVSIPIFDVGGKFTVQSAQQNLASKMSEKKSAIKEATDSIVITYKLLESQRKNYVTMNRNYEGQLAELNKIVDRIKAGQTQGLALSDLLVTVQGLNNQFSQVTETQSSILTNTFSVQQITGMLFNDVRIAF